MSSDGSDGQFEDMSAQMLEEAQVLWDEQSISSTDDDEDEGIYTANDFFVDFKKLKLDREVAEGGFGKIFKGEYLGTDVAIKKMLLSGTGDDEDIKYIEREVSTLKGIRHPNVVTFMGIAKHKGDFYIICEWVPKGDLTNVLGGEDDIPWPDRMKYAMDAAAAMVYLHDHGIIHRDLKAENLLLTDNGRIKICDLGFARTAKQLQRTMSIAGTGLYMAPEVVTGARYDAKCDVFGFGVVLFEIIARRLPPKRTIKTRFGFTEDMLSPFLDPTCPHELKKIMMDCLSYRSEDRPTFAEALGRLKALYTVVITEHERAQEEKRMEEAKAKEEKAKAKEERAKERRAKRDRKSSADSPHRRKKSDKKDMSAEDLVEERIRKEVESRLEKEKERLRAQVEAEMLGSAPSSKLSSTPAAGERKSKAAERRAKRRSWAPSAFSTLWVKEELKKEEQKHAQDDTTVVVEKRELEKREARRKKKRGKKKKAGLLEGRASSPVSMHHRSSDIGSKKHNSRKKKSSGENISTRKGNRDSEGESPTKRGSRRKGSLLKRDKSSDRVATSGLRKTDSLPAKTSKGKKGSKRDGKRRASKADKKSAKAEFVAL